MIKLIYNSWFHNLFNLVFQKKGARGNKVE